MVFSTKSFLLEFLIFFSKQSFKCGDESVCTTLQICYVHLYSLFFFFIWVFFHEHSRMTGLQGKGDTSQTLRHQLGDCCRELTSLYSQQLESNQEPLVFEYKLLTTNYFFIANPAEAYGKFCSCIFLYFGMLLKSTLQQTSLESTFDSNSCFLT